MYQERPTDTERESPFVLLSGTNLGIHAIHSPIKIVLSHLDSYKTQYKYLEKLEQKCQKINLAQGQPLYYMRLKNY